MLANYCFDGCTSLQILTNLPNSIKQFGIGVFSNCSKLIEITLPTQITELSMYCFYKCEELLTINNLQNVIQILDQCFSNCKQIQLIKLSPFLISIKNLSFSCCESLKEITYCEKQIISNDTIQNETNEIDYYKSNLRYFGTRSFEYCKGSKNKIFKRQEIEFHRFFGEKEGK